MYGGGGVTLDRWLIAVIGVIPGGLIGFALGWLIATGIACLLGWHG